MFVFGIIDRDGINSTIIRSYIKTLPGRPELTLLSHWNDLRSGCISLIPPHIITCACGSTVASLSLHRGTDSSGLTIYGVTSLVRTGQSDWGASQG